MTRQDAWEALKRGWSKTCPHCGKGPIFITWNKPYRHCPVCGYLYERDYGDVWWVWIVTDRIPIAIGIVMVYFGFRIAERTPTMHPSQDHAATSTEWNSNRYMANRVKPIR